MLNIGKTKFSLIFAGLLLFMIPSIGLKGAAALEEPKSTQAQSVEPPGSLQPEIKRRIKRIFSLGVSYYRSHKYEEALSAFQIALSFDPENAAIKKYVELAQDKIGERLLGREEAKQSATKKAIQKRIYDMYAAGLYAMRYKRFDDAINYFQEVLKLNPHHQGAWSKIITARTELERQRKMAMLEEEEVYRKPVALARVPTAAAAAELKQEERRERALAEKEAEVQLARLYSYAQQLLKLGRYEEAEEEFKKIGDIDPKYRNTTFYLADIYKIKEAIKREQAPYRYTLGAEDVLQINVLGHPELSSIATVEPGGEIVLPLIKEVVMANGLTKEELAEKIKGVLSKYVKEPEVQIVITGYNSKKWYILGEVAARGAYALGKTNLTLMEALYRAGLPIEGIAAMRRVILVKPHRTHPKYKAIDVFDILYNGRMQDNVRIEPGDIIYVPKTVLAKVTTILGHISTPFSGAKTGLEDLVATSAAARAATPLKDIFGETATSKK